MDRLVLYESFTSSSSYKPMLYLALARLPFSFHTVDLKTGAQSRSVTVFVVLSQRWRSDGTTPQRLTAR